MRKYFSDFPWNEYCFRTKDPSVCAQRITDVIVSAMEVSFHILFLLLMLKNLGSIMLVLVLSKIERLITKGTRTFQHLTIMHHIFLPEIVPNLFFDSTRTLSSTESVTTCRILTLQKTSGI